MYGNTVKDGSGTSYWTVQDAAGRLIPGVPFSASLQADVTDNDSDKVFTVPATTEWEVRSIFIKLVSSGTAGNRQITVQFRDGSDNVVMEMRAGIVQTASLTRYYQYGIDLPYQTTFVSTDLLLSPLPKDIILPAGYDIRIWDNAAVDAAADDMHIQMMIGTRPTV